LAGCLTIEEGGDFSFLQLNKFSENQPIMEDPLHCHSMVAMSHALDNYGSQQKKIVSATIVDASSGVPLQQVMTSLTSSEDSQNGLTGEDGVVSLSVRNDGDYTLLTELASYMPHRLTVTVQCPDQSVECKETVIVSMLHKPANESIELALSWDQSSNDEALARAVGSSTADRDLDIHILQVDKQDTQIFCETYFGNDNGCTDVTLNQNIQQGGQGISEIVSISNIGAHSGSETYMVFVDDNSVSGTSLFESEAHILLTDGTNSRLITMPGLTEDVVAGARYWLAGCLEVAGESFYYIPVNKFSRESPLLNEKFYCHNLFLNGGIIEPEEPFCPNTELKVKVRNSLDNKEVSQGTATVLLLDGDVENVVADGVSPDPETGVITVPITKNGHYVVKIESEGFISNQEDYTVNCEIADCGSCDPKHLAPLSPVLNEGELRMVLNWAEKPKDLDFYVMRRNNMNWNNKCTTYYAKKSGCAEATLDVDNRKGGNNGVETVTIHDISENDNNVYMIFAQHFGSSRIPEEFERSEAQIKVTDGEKFSSVKMNPVSYGGEKHWLAGCLRITGSSYQLRPVNMFLNARPDTEVPDLCLDTFGLTTTTTTTPRPRTTTTEKPWYRRIFG